MRTILICLLAIFYQYQVLADNVVKSGLHFTAAEMSQDLRTSLNLTPDKAWDLKDGFSMNFKIKFRPGDGDFGYIFRIIGDEHYNIDLVTHLGSLDTNFWLVCQDQTVLSFKWADINKGDFGKWMDIDLEIDTKGETLMLNFNGVVNTVDISGLSSLSSFQANFGASKIPGFISTDVAPMTVRDIQLKNHNQKIIRHWALEKHHHNLVYDKIGHKRAEALNPIWQVDKHLKWQKELAGNFNDLLGITFDEKTDRFFLVGKQEMYVYDVYERKIDTIRYLEGNPYFCFSNQVFYDTEKNQILSYSFEENKPNYFNFESKSWSQTNTQCGLPKFWHHNKTMVDNNLLTFGGYGFFTYKSVFQKFNHNSENWESHSLNESISPRYLSAMGVIGNELYIFGGYGSKTGNQQINPKYNYDLHSINMESNEVSPKWNLSKNAMAPFVPIEKLLPTADNNSFYTLVFDNTNFETFLKLVKIDRQTPTMTVFPDSLPYLFNDTKSWSSIYLNEGKSKLMTITWYEDNVSVYSMAYPPLYPEDVIQILPTENFNFRKAYLAVLMLLVVLVAAGFYMRKWRNQKELTILEVDEKEEFNVLTVDEENSHYTSSLFFLGGFQAYDRNGKDITAEFTPTLKQLFLLIFFSSANKGISSSKLTEYLWSDKSEVSARNNRNVNISKLRLLLEKIGPLTITKTNIYWKMEIPASIYVDYKEAIDLMKLSETSRTLNEEDIKRLLHLAGQGEICPNIQTEWIDPIKVHYSNSMIDSLLSLINSGSIAAENNPLLIDISDCILKLDILNEEALKIKCLSLCKMGKMGPAKKVFDKFAYEYEKSMGIRFRNSFNDFVLINH